MTSKKALGIPAKKRRGKPKQEIKVPPRLYLGNDSKEIAKVAIAGKNMGVKAVVDLPENTRIAYEGASITAAEYDDLVKLQRSGNPEYKNYAEYVAAADGAWVDAHPRRGNWINAFVNEPSEGKTANMRLTSEIFHNKRRPVFITVRPIKAGEELTAKYGGSYKRVGYTPGKIAPIPKWWKRRAKQ